MMTRLLIIGKLDRMKINSYLLLLVAGALYALGFPFYQELTIPFAPIIGIAIFFSHLFKCTSLKERLLSLLLFSVAYNWVGFYWIPHTLTEFGNLPFFISLILAQLFALIILPQYLIIALTLPYLRKLQVPALSLLFTLIEYFTPQQFPAHLGHAWLPLHQGLTLTPYFGAPLYSYLSFLIVLTLIEYKTHQRILRSTPLFLSLIFLLSLAALFQEKDQKTTSINLRLVQANIGNAIKLSSERGLSSAQNFIEASYYNLSIKESKEPIDLIVWPETAFPDDLTSFDFKMPEIFSRVIKKTQSELLIGGYDLSESTPFLSRNFEGVYNTAFHFDADETLKESYHKMKLIPFGETLPLGPLTEAASRIITNVSYFATGKRYSLFKTQKGTPFITLICYEILFPEFVRNFFKNTTERPQFIINLTNDSWYGDTSEPYQHLFLAKWRALEFQLPIIRATNTGITTIITPESLYEKTLGIFEVGVLDYKLSVGPNKPTYYERYGILLLIFIVLGKILIIYSFSKKSPSFKRS